MVVMASVVGRLLSAMLVVAAACGDNTAVPQDAAAPDAPPASLTIDQQMLAFGSVDVGSTSPAMTLTITNIGQSDTGPFTIVTAGTDATSFGADGSACATLQPGASCTAAITFSPQSAGAKSAKVKVSATPGGSISVAVTGIGRGTGPGLLAISSDTTMTGSALVGTYGQSVATFTLTNIGGDITGLLAIQLTGANPADFIVDDHCSGYGLAPNETCTLEARVAPKERGERHATIEVSASPGGLVTGDVVGTGIAPAKLVTSFSHRDLGTVASGASTTTTITLTNTGDVATSAITATYVGGSGFSSGGGTCINAAVAPGASCTVIASFSSTTTGTHTSQVTIDASPQGAKHLVVALDVAVTDAAQLAISPSSVELAATQVGNTSTTQTFTVTNNGASSSGALATSATSSTFTISADTCASQSLAPGATCTLAVAFAPGAAQPSSGWLDVVSPASGSASASVAGVGQATASFAISSSRGFGAIAVGSHSDASLTLTNVGGVASGAPALSVTGANAGEFSTTTSCAAALAPGGSCTIWVRYAPASAHASTATLGISASPGGTASTDLAGTAVAAGGVTISPPSYVFADSAVGVSTQPQVFTVRNTSAIAITDLSVTGDTTFVTPSGIGDWCGTMLAAGASCQVSAAFHPSAAGSASGTVDVTGGGSSASSSVAGSGLPLFTVVAIDNVASAATSFDFGNQSIAPTHPDDAFIAITTYSQSNPFLRVTEQYGTPAQYVTLGSDCGMDLSPGVPCTLRIRFAPTSTSSQPGTATFKACQYVDGTGTQLTLPFTVNGTGVP
jgi:hypothetical protein